MFYYRLMFFVDKDGEKSKLCRARMDGFELSDIVKNLDEPISKFNLALY